MSLIVLELDGVSRSADRCRALVLLRATMIRRGVSLSKVARDLDRSWTYARKLVAGETRPSIDDVAVLRERYGVPSEAWRQW